jgi:hypothetical protein
VLGRSGNAAAASWSWHVSLWAYAHNAARVTTGPLSV